MTPVRSRTRCSRPTASTASSSAPAKGRVAPLRFPLEEAAVEAVDRGLRLRFFLPKGAYATALLREVMKKNPEADGPGDADEGEV